MALHKIVLIALPPPLCDSACFHTLNNQQAFGFRAIMDRIVFSKKSYV